MIYFSFIICMIVKIQLNKITAQKKTEKKEKVELLCSI